MSSDKKLCHGQFDGLTACSAPLGVGKVDKCMWRLRVAIAHLCWHLKTKGCMKTFEIILYKALKAIGLEKNHSRLCVKKEQSNFDEVEILNLKVGEMVEVKTEQEILATLNQDQRYKGLYWMANMRKFCGKKYRVYKRLGRILLESTGEHRTVKNTVLLEGVVCDGQEWQNCDRSCFHFWREAWLRRVEHSE